MQYKPYMCIVRQSYLALYIIRKSLYKEQRVHAIMQHIIYIYKYPHQIMQHKLNIAEQFEHNCIIIVVFALPMHVFATYTKQSL